MSTQNRDWLNQNETRNYPFKEGVSRKSTSGYVLPNDFIVDLVLSGTKDREQVFPTIFEEIDYFIHAIERVASTETVIRVREIRRNSYNQMIPTTFTDVGEFIVPFKMSKDQQYSFIPTSTTQIQGKLVIRQPLDETIPIGLLEFTPEATLLEARTLIPLPGLPRVTTISKDGDAFRAFGNVVLGEKRGVDITPVTTANGLRFDYVDLRECATLNEDGGCLDAVEHNCPQPAVMKLNNAESDRNFNFKISGSNGINVSTLPILNPGGNPFNPNDYSVNSIVVTYHGQITAAFNGGDPLDPSNYTYGLDCKQTPLGQALPSLLAQAEALVSQLEVQQSILDGI